MERKRKLFGVVIFIIIIIYFPFSMLMSEDERIPSIFIGCYRSDVGGKVKIFQNKINLISQNSGDLDAKYIRDKLGEAISSNVPIILEKQPDEKYKFSFKGKGARYFRILPSRDGFEVIASDKMGIIYHKETC